MLHVHTLWPRVLMCAKDNVSMIKPVARRTVHIQCQMTTMTHDGQFMTVWALWHL